MSKKILIVDDELNIVKLMAARLTANGYQVVVAYDAMQAVRLAHKEKPDLIILDVRMPAGSGVSVYENLKLSTETAMTPVIYVTAYANDNLREKVEEMGAAGFLAKPFEADDLLALVRQALGDDTPEQPDEK